VNRPPVCSVASHAYFLDFDGTLVEFEESPAHTRVSKPLRLVIDTLFQRSNGATALISGRALAEIDRIFHAPPRLPAAGQHGMERRSASGVVHAVQIPSARLDQVRRLLSVALQTHPGAMLEDKDQSLALHFRGTPRLADTAWTLMSSMQKIAGPRYIVLRGKYVVELKPGGRDKGHAIVEFMQEEPFTGRVPVFVGDDETDEDGFKMVNRLRGISIKVGTGATSAAYGLPDPRSVIDWLSSQSD
jgi:trehalose 6-phosphate phosphatase